MKKSNLKNLIILTVMIFTSASIFAQPNKGPKQKMQKDKYFNIPDLTDKQKKEIDTLRTTVMKEILPLRNELNEKEANLQTVSTSEKVDMNKVYKKIEEIGNIKLNIAKKKAKQRQDIRILLTDEQRVFFDMHYGKHNAMHKKQAKKKNSGNR